MIYLISNNEIKFKSLRQKGLKSFNFYKTLFYIISIICTIFSIFSIMFLFKFKEEDIVFDKKKKNFLFFLFHICYVILLFNIIFFLFSFYFINIIENILYIFISLLISILFLIVLSKFIYKKYEEKLEENGKKPTDYFYTQTIIFYILTLSLLIFQLSMIILINYKNNIEELNK